MFFPCLLDFVQISFSKESLIGKKGLIHRTQLVDPKLGIGYPSTPILLPLFRPGKRHQLNNFLHHKIAELDLVEQRRPFWIKQVASKRCDAEDMVVKTAKRT